MAEEYGKCTKDGGKPVVRPMPYSKPKGPKAIEGTGAKGTNVGKAGTQKKG